MTPKTRLWITAFFMVVVSYTTLIWGLILIQEKNFLLAGAMILTCVGSGAYKDTILYKHYIKLK